MALHRRTKQAALGSVSSITTAGHRWISPRMLLLLLLLLTERAEAYSIRPPAVARGFHTAGRRRLPRPRAKVLALSAAGRNHDWTRNATAVVPVVEESPGSDGDFDGHRFDCIEDIDDDDEDLDLRLLRSMLEAMADLESFQATSSSSSLDPLGGALDAGKSPPRPLPLDSDFTASTSTSTSELSLLFPAAKASTEPKASTPGERDGPESAAAEKEGVWRARWLLVGAAALYGTNFSVVKLLGDEMPVGISTTLRFGLAALATFPWLVEGWFAPAGRPGEGAPTAANQRFMATMYGLEVGLWNSIGYVSQAVGLETTLASKSAFICSMAVVIVPLLDWLAGKKLLPRQWVGALMALVGVAFLELGGIGPDLLSAGGGITTGDRLSLVQPLTFGLGFWRMEQAMHLFPREAPRMTAAQLLAIFCASAGYGLWTLGVFGGPGAGADPAGLESIAAAFPWRDWCTDPSILFSLFWTGCVTTALTIYMETLALESLSAAETTLIFSTEPLWGTAFAVAVMGEQMGTNAVVGAGLILAACLYSNLGVGGLAGLWASASQRSPRTDRNPNRIEESTDLVARPAVRRSAHEE